MEAYNLDMDYVVGRCRWGTSEKNTTISKYLKSRYGQDYKEYVGIASDETRRINKEYNKHKLFPLIEWGISENECLEYCYKRGFNWEENNICLYDVLDCVSCWCCANKNNKELENYRRYLPEYFEKISNLTYQILSGATNYKLKENTNKFLERLEKIKLLEVGEDDNKI